MPLNDCHRTGSDLEQQRHETPRYETQGLEREPSGDLARWHILFTGYVGRLKDTQIAEKRSTVCK